MLYLWVSLAKQLPICGHLWLNNLPFLPLSNPKLPTTTTHPSPQLTKLLLVPPQLPQICPLISMTKLFPSRSIMLVQLAPPSHAFPSNDLLLLLPPPPSSSTSPLLTPTLPPITADSGETAHTTLSPSDAAHHRSRISPCLSRGRISCPPFLTEFPPRPHTPQSLES